MPWMEVRSPAAPRHRRRLRTSLQRPAQIPPRPPPARAGCPPKRKSSLNRLFPPSRDGCGFNRPTSLFSGIFHRRAHLLPAKNIPVTDLIEFDLDSRNLRAIERRASCRENGSTPPRHRKRGTVQAHPSRRPKSTQSRLYWNDRRYAYCAAFLAGNTISTSVPWFLRLFSEK